MQIKISDKWLCTRHAFIPSIQLQPVEAYTELLKIVLFKFADRADIRRECGEDKNIGKSPDAALLQSAIAHHSPLCCFLGDAEMEQIYSSLHFTH